MFELLLLAIALCGSLAAGLYDLKTSNIPDVLCIAMIIAGLGLHSYVGLTTGDFTNLTNSLIYGGLFLAFGLLMYFTGQWGGGDGELLVAMGVLLSGIAPVSYFPFEISFFINSFFVGAAYSVIYAVILAMKSPKMISGFSKSIRKPIVVALMAIFLGASAVSLIFSALLASIFFLSFVMVVFWKFAKAIENGFYKRIPTSKLKVDDMIGEDIPRLRIYKKLIKGLTKSQVDKIKKMKRYVLIKEGIRYGLVFFLTLVFTLLVGDIFLFLV